MRRTSSASRAHPRSPAAGLPPPWPGRNGCAAAGPPGSRASPRSRCPARARKYGATRPSTLWISDEFAPVRPARAAGTSGGAFGEVAGALGRGGRVRARAQRDAGARRRDRRPGHLLRAGERGGRGRSDGRDRPAGGRALVLLDDAYRSRRRPRRRTATRVAGPMLVVHWCDRSRRAAVLPRLCVRSGPGAAVRWSRSSPGRPAAAAPWWCRSPSC